MAGAGELGLAMENQLWQRLGAGVGYGNQPWQRLGSWDWVSKSTTAAAGKPRLE